MALLAGTIVCQYIRNSFFLLALVGSFSCKDKKMKQQDELPFYNSAQFDAEWIDKSDDKYATIHTIDTFALNDQLGNIITKDSLDGYVYVANFFFTTCPGICPKMVGNLQILQNIFANNNQLKLVSFSVMPWVDSVARLKEYGELHNIHPVKWYLLTGSKDRIYDLGRKSYFAEKGLGLLKDNDEFLHTETMLLIDKKGRIRGIYNATQKPDIERVTEDINTLLKE